MRVTLSYLYKSLLSYTKKFEYRRSKCKLSISAHSLNIEVGRYKKTPRNERFCKKCNTGEIEDKMHFYFYAIILKLIGKIYYKNIVDLVAGEVKNFHTLSYDKD